MPLETAFQGVGVRTKRFGGLCRIDFWGTFLIQVLLPQNILKQWFFIGARNKLHKILFGRIRHVISGNVVQKKMNLSIFFHQ